MAFFTYAGSKFAEKPITVALIVANSETVHKGGWINTASGFADAADAGETLWGVCLEIQTKDGVPLGAHLGSEIDGTFTPQSGATAETYAAASDNQTDKQVKVLVNIDPSAMYYNEPDAAIGTTSGSNLQGGYTDLISDVQVDENNNGNAFTTVAQLDILGVNPGNSAQGIYMKRESQI